MRDGNVALNVWGFFSLLLVLANFSTPLHDKADLALRAFTILNTVLFTMRAMLFTRKAIKVALPVALFLVIQAWSFVSYYIGFGQTARANDWGRQMYFILELSLPYFIAASLCSLDSRWRDKVVDAVFWLCIISGTLAFYEFLRLPGGRAISGVYYLVDLVHNREVERPSGLTHHAGILGFEMVVGLSICAGRIYSRGVKPIYIAGGAVMTVALIASQAKTNYVPGALLVVIIGGVTALYSKRSAAFIAVLAAIVAILGLYFFRNRLGYVFNQKYSIDSISARQSEWAYNYRAAAPYWLTGVGPDTSLLGSGLGSGRFKLAESAYLMFFCMFGILGLALFVGSLLSAIWASGIRLIDRSLSLELRGFSITILITVFALALNGYISNLAVDNAMIQLTVLLGGAYFYSLEQVLPAAFLSKRMLVRPAVTFVSGKRLR